MTDNNHSSRTNVGRRPSNRAALHDESFLISTRPVFVSTAVLA